MLISGEPGIGKTAVLACLLDRAAADGARVVSGAAEELEMRVPFAAVSDCLGLIAAAADPKAAEIAAMLRGAHGLSAGALAAADADFLVTEAILGLVDGWCAAGPVVLAVDDLQWADPASLLVLHRLGRVAGQLPLLLAAACRPGAAGADLEPLVRSWETRGAEMLSLEPPAMREAEAARDEGLASGDAYAMAYGLQAVAGASRWQGRFSQALDLADQAAAALDQADPIMDSQLDPHLIRANCVPPSTGRWPRALPGTPTTTGRGARAWRLWPRATGPPPSPCWPMPGTSARREVGNTAATTCCPS